MICQASFSPKIKKKNDIVGNALRGCKAYAVSIKGFFFQFKGCLVCF